MMIQNTENDSKILKFEAFCTETSKLSLQVICRPGTAIGNNMLSRYPNVVQQTSLSQEKGGV